MTLLRSAGYISLNGEPYFVQKDGKTGDFAYSRASTPRKDVQSTRRNVFTGQSNMLEAQFNFVDGFGDEVLNDTRDTYHWASNLYMARESEAVVLPGAHALLPDEDDINLSWSPPVFVWEQISDIGDVELFWLGDHRAFTLRSNSGMTLGVDEDMFFENTTRPTGGTTFNNYAYAAMGGGQETQDRYLRRRDPSTGTWTNDDNNPLSVIGAGAGAAGGTLFETSVAHGYLVGEVVFISASTVVAHDGLWTISAVPDTTHFDVNADTNQTTATATVNMQDSDVKAEQLCIVSDEMVRTYYDAANGWSTSRVDIVGSNELLEANWTAGIGALNVGDANSKPTALVATGSGELIGKPEGVFRYDTDTGLYGNEIPELEEHRHPDNCRGMFEYKGWVYIPTVIGLLRWKDGITQDVTPRRVGIPGYQTPIGPVAFITGDANRLYAITQPFSKNLTLEADAATVHFAYDLTGAGVITTDDADITDTLRSTYIDLNGLQAAGYFYVACVKKFHRLHAEINDGTGNKVTNGSVLSGQYFNGTTWVTRTIRYDGTRGWDSTDDDPTTLHETGDIVWGTPVNETTGEDDWAVGSPAADNELDQTMYWMRFSVDAAIDESVQLTVIFVGAHDENAFVPYSTTEVEHDHGGVVQVLSMTEEQGRGVIWHTMWTFAVPDYARTSGINVGGAQRVGSCRIVQPRNGAILGERYLFIGLENLSYLCPLGNAPDPTMQPFPQFYPATGQGLDGGVRPIQLVTPFTDFGLNNTLKTFREVEFQTDGVDLSSVEVWYNVDFSGWVFLGMADDLTPNMPIVFPAGSEPSGYQIAIGISYDADAERPQRLDRFYTVTLRVQPRPEMSETIRMTLELDYDQALPGATKRRSPHNAYADLRALQLVGSVPFRNLSGDTEYVEVLQVSQRAVHNANSKPKLIADVIMSVCSTRTDAP